MNIATQASVISGMHSVVSGYNTIAKGGCAVAHGYSRLPEPISVKYKWGNRISEYEDHIEWAIKKNIIGEKKSSGVPWNYRPPKFPSPEEYGDCYFVPHRDEKLGAAKEFKDGSKVFCRNGEYHRESGPALCLKDNHLSTSYMHWYHKGQYFLSGVNLDEVYKEII